MKKRLFYFSVLVLSVFIVKPFEMLGQQTVKLTDPYEHFRHAKLLFDSNNFPAAQEEFRFYLKTLQENPSSLISERTSVEYFIAMCSIYSMRPEAEIQAVKFVADHPESPFSAKLITEIGVFYYETGDWARAIKYLSNSAQTNLEHKYYLAVSYYKSSQYKEALALFNLLKFESEDEYSLPAAYYAGVMHFHAEKFDQAIEDFKLASADPKYATEAPVWISSAYMKLNRYNDLIGYVKPILADSSYQQSSGNLASIIAELQFQKQDFVNAAKSYAVVKLKSPSMMTRERSYKHAFSLYKSKQLDEALTLLASIDKSSDSLGQEMAKTRALILVDQQKWELAYQALQEVASMSFNKELADESYLMYLSLLQQNQQWATLLKEIKAYQKRVPQNKHGEMLVSLAIDALQKQASLSAMEDFMLNFPVGKVKFQELYQATCYQIASKAYDKQEDRKAITYFKKSLDFSVNREMAWYARYALAEMLARSNKNSDAIKLYVPLLAETALPTGSRELSQRIRLSLAHSFAYITMYDRSLQYFEEYVANKLDGRRSVEDLRNLAELSIAKGDLPAGLKYFDEAILQNTPQTPNLLERKATILFNLRKFKESAEVYQTYRAKFPNDPLADKMFYQSNVALARLQKTESYAEVIRNTSQFIQEKSTTNPLFAPFLLIRAQAYENTNQWFLAMDDYVQIVRKFTTDSSAKEAIIGANELLKKAGRHSEAMELYHLYASHHGDDPSLADQWFDICTEMFQQAKYKLVVPELVRLIQEYPAYAQSDALNYMLGVSTYHTKDFGNALVYLKRSQQGLSFANKSQWMMALIYEEQKRADLAINQLVDLKANIPFQDTLMVDVQDKLKQLYGQQKKFDLLNQLWADLDASDSLRKSLWALEIGQFAIDAAEFEISKKWFVKSVDFSQDEVGAKAALAYAKVLATQKEYKKANDWLVLHFVQADSRFYHLPDATVGQAYLAMVDNFILLKNNAQAKVILQSILANSSDDAIKVLAKKKMEGIL
jgi:tetratricopeptide (TPR) repeat protein